MEKNYASQPYTWKKTKIAPGDSDVMYFPKDCEFLRVVASCRLGKTWVPFRDESYPNSMSRLSRKVYRVTVNDKSIELNELGNFGEEYFVPRGRSFGFDYTIFR